VLGIPSQNFRGFFMFGLFANVDVTPVVESSSLFPVTFWSGVLGTVIYALIAAVLFPLFWKLIDLVTPGNLNAQLLGSTKEKDNVTKSHTPDGKPNIALAIVVGFLCLGFCIILAAAIH
jgi:hypothetical protein